MYSSLSDSSGDSEDGTGDSDKASLTSGRGAVPFKKRLMKAYQETSTDNDHQDEPPVKKFKAYHTDSVKTEIHELGHGDGPRMANIENSTYSSKAMEMMARMGHKEGTGLGKNEQGIKVPIEQSLQKGKRGLGLKLSHFQPDASIWTEEEIQLDETVDWLPVCKDAIPSLDEMKSWIKIGPVKQEIDDEMKFCNQHTLKEVLLSKSKFDELEGEEMRRARTRSNPYETIRGVIFQNRAAMKMANMDQVLDFMFTNPKNAQGKSMVAPNELLYFADICAGPGGFSEYVLWRRKLDCKGFGFTLKGSNDFKLEEFLAAPSELFEPHYGVGGIEGDGDIYKKENLIAFRQFVKDNTDGQGVHFVMADGGFSVEGKENIQEILSKRLYLCQFLCALSVLKTGGHFVCKLFDLFTEYSVGLVYLMYLAFEQVAIFKPVTSRPANSERYIICKSLRPGSDQIHDYMFDLNLQFDEIRFGSVRCTQDINSVLPLDIMQSNTQFFDYIFESNESIGKLQVLNLTKIQMFAKNTDLYETRQSLVRVGCLKRWQIPDEIRKSRKKADVQIKFEDLMEDEKDESYFNPLEMTILQEDSLETIKSVYDYKCIVSGCTDRLYLLSLGRTHIFKWDGRSPRRWRKLDEVKLELPSDTLIEVEVVQELRGQGKGQRKTKAIHITDILFLYGEDYRKLHLTERIEKAKKFAKAVNKSSRPDLAPLRVKDILRLEEIKHVFEKLQLKSVKGSTQPKICYSCDETHHYIPTGLVLVKTIEEPWTMAFSRSQKRKYFYNIRTKESRFEVPAESVAPVQSCLKNRMYWTWERGVKLVDNDCLYVDNSKLSRDQVLNFVHSKIQR